jgi:glutamate synthase (NADPH/NADH) small chain
LDKQNKKPKLDLVRLPMIERSPRERRGDFHEVPVGYSDEAARMEATRCLNCRNRPCKGGCPVAVDCRRFVERISAGDFVGAIRTIKERNLLPAITGRVCPQTEQCEGTCLMGRKGSSIGIGNLERFAADWEREHGVVLPDKGPATGKSVGVVGSGPSGLTVAADMVVSGHEVTVYEALHEPGGVLLYGIPEFRLPKSIVAEQIESLKTLGVKFKLNHVIGNTLTLDDLLEIHDAVFIGVGAGAPSFMSIPGENLIGVYSANEYLTRSNLMRSYLFPDWDTPLYPGKRVAVIGGGTVAMDAARTSLRLGADEVTVIYRRSRDEMTARAEEVRHALEEGIDLVLLNTPKRILGEPSGRVSAIELLKMQLTEPDQGGRRRPVPIEGSEHIKEVDTVIVAIGGHPNPLLLRSTKGINVNRWGYIMTDKETMATSREGVYAGGDIAGWGANVIKAMGDGRRAAKAINEYLTAEPLRQVAQNS